ncbi:MAG: hypothetical protein PHW54_02095 [Candidatus Omnitrophica bacterium]|nr:hypothetical protein [Candidatus Omnitrophota bacterium]
MQKLLLQPPVAFILLFIIIFIISRILSRVSFKANKHSAGSGKSYACGEDSYNNMAQPDYSEFFPFAFFFTLAHVATLIMTTVPMETFKTFAIAIIYVLAAVLGLYILLRS